MVDIAVQATIPYKTNLPADVAVNTWSFDVADDTTSSLGEGIAFCAEFYQQIMNRMSPILDMEDIRYKVYVRSDLAPAPPRLEVVVPAGTGNTGAALPEEVAMVLTFRGAPAPGANPNRRRGRVFLGPLSENALSTETSRTVIAPAAIGDVGNAYVAARAELTGSNQHVVWSPTNGSSTPVAQVDMDNAFDTQRSRGPLPTSRSILFPTA